MKLARLYRIRFQRIERIGMDGVTLLHSIRCAWEREWEREVGECVGEECVIVGVGV